jgi:hypothetical protein
MIVTKRVIKGMVETGMKEQREKKRDVQLLLFS